MEKHNVKLYFIAMVFCFLYAGLSLFLAISQGASISRIHYIENYLSDVLIGDEDVALPDVVTDQNASSQGKDLFAALVPNDFFSESLYLYMFANILGFMVSLGAGVSILFLLRGVDKKEAHRSMVESVTTPEDKRVIKCLESAGGELTQSEIVKNSGLTKVKVHRIVKRLESFGIIEKFPYGMTNKIRLKTTDSKQ